METQHLKVKITPNAPKSMIKSPLADGTLKISVKSAPENGKANQEAIQLLAQHYQVRESQISLISGHTSQLKLFRLET